MTRTERNVAAAGDPPARHKLPIGIQTFREIRKGSCDTLHPSSPSLAVAIRSTKAGA